MLKRSSYPYIRFMAIFQEAKKRDTLKKKMEQEIKFYNRQKDQIEVEKVYGGDYINWVYKGTILSNFVLNIICLRPLSKIFGYFQEVPASVNKIESFIKDYSIDMEEFLPEEGMDDASTYASFNSFFIRRFKDGVRNFISDPKRMPAFAEGRYFGFGQVDPSIKLPVKGRNLSASLILNSDLWGELFQHGPVLIARLCPVDYHRFHFPDDGKILDHYRIKGPLHSVNPIALRKKGDIFFTNERQITVIETENFGKIAYVEVGAVCVGKIVQTHKDKNFKRGDEKGHFLFGGSTVIIFGEKGKWAPSVDILEYTGKGFETYVRLGEPVGEVLSN